MIRNLGAFLAARVNTPLALVTTVLSALPAAVATNPQLVQSFGQAPAPGSDNEIVTQVISAVLTLVLIMIRGGGNKVDPNVLKSFAAALIVASCVPQAVYAQTAIDSMNLTFDCTRPTVRDDAESIAIPATEALTFKVWEVSLTGVKGAAPVVQGQSCPLTLKGVKGTKRYVMTVSSDFNKNDSAPSSPPVLVTSSAPKPPGAVQVRVVFTTTP